MPQHTTPPNHSLIPPEPMPDQANAFSEHVRDLLNGQPKDEATCEEAFAGMEEMFDRIAAGLYSLASMLVGEGEDSVRLVETAVANAEVSACQDPAQARKSSRRTLAASALSIMEQRNPGCLAAPEWLNSSDICIEDDDLAAAGVSSEELANMIAGPDRDRVRKWLAGLPVAMRTVFVLRAVAGFTTAETAEMLRSHARGKAAEWTPSAVSEIFRQGLCSLASQLLHSTVER